MLDTPEAKIELLYKYQNLLFTQSELDQAISYAVKTYNESTLPAEVGYYGAIEDILNLFKTIREFREGEVD
ncbi:MAG: hypothetical protein GF411_00030 [Candidatus Lokiarchaeota archaeon]|nr:hypothetical protein [Candidatus Lokiarchaeota archaeon]